MYSFIIETYLGRLSVVAPHERAAVAILSRERATFFAPTHRFWRLEENLAEGKVKLCNSKSCACTCACACAFVCECIFVFMCMCVRARQASECECGRCQRAPATRGMSTNHQLKKGLGGGVTLSHEREAKGVPLLCVFQRQKHKTHFLFFQCKTLKCNSMASNTPSIETHAGTINRSKIDAETDVERSESGNFLETSS